MIAAPRATLAATRKWSQSSVVVDSTSMLRQKTRRRAVAQAVDIARWASVPGSARCPSVTNHRCAVVLDKTNSRFPRVPTQARYLAKRQRLEADPNIESKV